jgi:WD40 repeat protein
MKINNHYLLLVLIILAGLTLGLLAFPVSAQGGSPRIIHIASNGQGRVHAVVYSPDGQSLAVGSSLGINLYKSSDLQPIHFTPTDTWVRALAFSPDSSLLASSSYDPIVRLWRVNDGTLLKELSGHTAWVRALVFSPDGKLLATASDDDTVRLWNIPDGNLFHTYDKGTVGVRAVAFSPDGTILATGGYDKIIRLWKVSDGTLLRELKGHTDWVRALVFSPDGESLASGAFDTTVRLWRVSDGELLVTRQEHASSVLGLAFSPDGELLASASVDTTVRLWKMPALEPYDLLRDHTDFVFSVAFSPDGTNLASGAVDNTVRVWNVPVQANPVAQEHVSSPSNCKTCHHPRSAIRPARVIEVSCAVCHPDGALVLNWCPVLPRASGGTTLQVSYNNIHGEKAGVPQATSNLDVVIATPGNGEHVYTPQDIITLIPINGNVYSKTYPLTEIELQLEVWAGSDQLAIVSSRPDENGRFSFSATIRPEGSEPYPGFLGRNYCVACHQEAQTILPQGEVRLVVVAVAPDGTRTFDERWAYVDHSQRVILPLQVFKEDGQPAPNIPVLSETRLYEWRGRTFTAISDSKGQVSLQVEALSQNPTTYQISVPPTVINGVLYESKESVQVTLPPGATTAPTVTLHVQMASGEISGHVTGLNTPVQVWAILPDGAAHTATTSLQGVFTFVDLPVSQYLLVADPQALAEQGLVLSAESIDLSQELSAQVNLIPKPLEGASLSWKITDETGASLPFGWVSVDTQTGQADPASGAYALFGIPASKATAIINAPGYYSQAHYINILTAAIPSMSFNLVRRPETLQIPWGDGAITIPPETVSRLEGQKITFEQGWLWGTGESEQPLVIQWEDMQITIPGGQFALERLPARSGWLYVMEGQAFIQQADSAEAVAVQAGEMVFLSQKQEPHPVLYDPVVVSALRLNSEVPIQPVWQLSLGAQVRDRLAKIGIGTAQFVTFITYFIEVLALLAIPLLAVNWLIRKRKEK